MSTPFATTAPLTPLKVCVKCGEPKPRSEYGTRGYRRGDLHPWCLVCRREASKVSRLKNLAHYRQANRNWNASNPEKMRVYQERHYAKKKKQIIREAA